MSTFKKIPSVASYIRKDLIVSVFHFNEHLAYLHRNSQSMDEDNTSQLVRGMLQVPHTNIQEGYCRTIGCEECMESNNLLPRRDRVEWKVGFLEINKIHMCP